MFPVEMSEAYFFCKREFLKKKKNLIRAFWLL
jgi:hypothetical protein